MVEVSVIMSVYNEGNRDILKLAVESILNQTFKNFELIICDDGSTDNSFEVLQELAQKDSRIKLCRSRINLKAGGARNFCLSIATGEYVAIMDADDYSSSDRLEKQLAFLRSNQEYAFVVAKGCFFEHYPGDKKQEYWFCQNPHKQDFLMTLPFVHASLMFRRNVLRSIGGYRTEKQVIRSEDYDLLMRLYAQGLKGFNIDTVLYYIRQDQSTFRRRKYHYRLNECYVKLNGFIKLGLMPRGIIYAIKPLIVGFIPNQLLNRLKRKYYKNKYDRDEI
jgi:glycosyltransferase involved in cell wall biosynthesis